MSRHYSNPDREGEPYSLPDIETFYVSPKESTEEQPSGWYWWTCFPGCLPDSDPFGPFDTEEAAVSDTRRTFDD